MCRQNDEAICQLGLESIPLFINTQIDLSTATWIIELQKPKITDLRHHQHSGFITYNSSEMSSSSAPLLLQAGTQIYIPDDAYAWLPATLQHDVHEGEATTTSITVIINLPSDWARSTIADVNTRSVTDGEERTVRLAEFIVPPNDNATHLFTHLSDLSTVVETSDTSTDSSSAEARPRYHFPLANKDGATDLAELDHLNEAAMLYNIKDRLCRRKPYTRVGDIIVAVNPYQVSCV